MPAALRILHFNDVYRCTPQKLAPNSTDVIDVTQFGAMLDSLRAPEGNTDALVLFSGDVFSPSVESSVTRGSHLVPVMNELKPDVALAGNHDFDFGYPHLCKLIGATNFPWLLSNIVDTATSLVPASLQEYHILERDGLRIGIIGLVEKEWIGTVATWPPNFEYKDMKTVGLDLSSRLRGEHGCDLVIALTHCRLPNDISLAKDLLALSPAAQAQTPIASSHGVDLLLGGHDHVYFASKFTPWENYDTSQNVLGAEADNGDALVCKSGTDFRDLSEIFLEFATTPPGSVRKKVIKQITGKRHSTKPGSKSSEKLSEIIKTVLTSVTSTLKAPVCNTTVTIDVRSEIIRTKESAAGNWFADVLRHAYDDTLQMKGGSDGVLICAGTLRGDSIYGPGPLTLGDIKTILPFEDPIIVVEIDGATIWDALEASLGTWPAQEGRFPVISGFRISWDSAREIGQRVNGIWLLKEEDNASGHTVSGHSTPRLVDGEEIQKTHEKTYKIVTRQYMADGHDGFVALKRGKHIIDDEVGQLASTIVRRYLMGSHYVNKMARLAASDVAHLHATTKSAITREKSRIASQWKHAARLALRSRKQSAHYQEHLNVCTIESMSCIDPVDGEKMRSGQSLDAVEGTDQDEDLPSISPEVDGRLKVEVVQREGE